MRKLLILCLLPWASSCCGVTARLEVFMERQALRCERLGEVVGEASREDLERFVFLEGEAWRAALRSVRVEKEVSE